MREELVTRNVARLVCLPEWHPVEVQPWSAEEAKQFLHGARHHRQYAAYLLLLLYGLRRGEVLGLRWCDISFETNQIQVRQQLQRVGQQLVIGDVKTRSGRRTLPLMGIAREVLIAHREGQDRLRAAAGTTWHAEVDHEALVFTTAVGTPIEPRNFVRSFWRVCEQHGVRIIKLHHLRHTTATFLKQLGVPARDAQLILGHSSVTVTQQIYQHDDDETRREALGRVERVLVGVGGGVTAVASLGYCRQQLPSNDLFVDQITSFLSGGPAGNRTQDTLLKRQVL
jgi:integrase